MSEWQPIETAPKDGTRVLVYGTYQWEDYLDRQQTGAVTAYYIAADFWDDEDIGWVLISTNPYRDRAQPTHWMPLPEPPR